MSMLTDVQAVKGRFHWGDSTAWRMPGGGAQVRTQHTLAMRWLHKCTSAILESVHLEPNLSCACCAAICLPLGSMPGRSEASHLSPKACSLPCLAAESLISLS